jgi:hypothetical protein
MYLTLHSFIYGEHDTIYPLIIISLQLFIDINGYHVV